MNYIILELNRALPRVLLVVVLATLGPWLLVRLVERAAAHHSAESPAEPQIALHHPNSR